MACGWLAWFSEISPVFVGLSGPGPQARKRVPKDSENEETPPRKGGDPKPPAAAPANKRRRKGEEPTPTPDKPSGDKPSSDKPSAEKGDRIEGLLSNGKDSLEELTPEVIWRSKIRGAELDRRIGRGSGVDRDLQKVLSNKQASQAQKDRATALQEEVTALAEAVSTMKLAFMAIRNQDGASLADEILGVSSQSELVKNITKCAHKLLTDFDIVIDIVHTVAKKLIEALGLAFPALFK